MKHTPKVEVTYTKPCPICGGAGEHETGQRESETGHPITDSCTACNGDGEVPLKPEDVCSQCSEPLEDEEGICAECRSENARDELADNAYDLEVEGSVRIRIRKSIASS